MVAGSIPAGRAMAQNQTGRGFQALAPFRFPSRVEEFALVISPDRTIDELWDLDLAGLLMPDAGDPRASGAPCATGGAILDTDVGGQQAMKTRD